MSCKLCSAMVGSESLPRVRELKYLRVSFTGEAKMEREVCRRFGAASAGIRTEFTSPSNCG